MIDWVWYRHIITYTLSCSNILTLLSPTIYITPALRTRHSHHTRTCTCAHTHTHIYMYMCTYATYVHVHVHTHIHIYMYMCTYTTYVHVHMYIMYCLKRLIMLKTVNSKNVHSLNCKQVPCGWSHTTASLGHMYRTITTHLHPIIQPIHVCGFTV